MKADEEFDLGAGEDHADFLTEIMERVEQMISPEDNTPENVSGIADAIEDEFYERYKGDAEKVTDADITSAIETRLEDLDE